MNKLNSSFGYTKVKPKEKTKLVQNVFSEVAKNYDLMNDLMSFGSHRLWKKKFVEIINPKKDEVIIDVGSGTGDIAKNILKTKFNGELHLLDLNPQMLNISKLTIGKNINVYFHQGNAEDLKFKKNTFDKYTIAFCLRNITNIEKSIEEALRVLKPGGIYFCLEFSSPNSILTSQLYKKYRTRTLPLIGKLIAKNKEAYKYLSESIDLFPNQEKLKYIIEKIGFSSVSYINLFDGIVAIHKGYKI
jgi:demethylmenaquinone methyltransferase/2-methoxy-6-polyprenyl-1,4-benzoquinol methylase